MIKHVQQQSITDFDLGEMQLYENRILLVKASEVVDLYYIEDDLEITKDIRLKSLDSGMATKF